VKVKIIKPFDGPDNPNVERKETHRYGLGVYATASIPKYTFISSFDAETRISREGALALPVGPDFSGRHAIQIGLYRWRDGRPDGIARYLAHSCNPNCGIVHLNTLVTMRDIRVGEELTWDYAMTEDSDFVMKCMCHSLKCRKTVGSFRMLSEHQRQDFVLRYKGFISQWLVDKYKLYQ
jgi:SET domain-containing protein